MLKIRLQYRTKKNRGHLVSPPLTNVDYRSRSEITVLKCEQEPYPVWLSCRRKSYPVKSVRRFKVFENRGHLVSSPLTNVDYRSRSEITVLKCEQEPYPVWLSRRRKSYPVKSVRRFKVFDFEQ